MPVLKPARIMNCPPGNGRDTAGFSIGAPPNCPAASRHGGAISFSTPARATTSFRDRAPPAHGKSIVNPVATIARPDRMRVVRLKANSPCGSGAKS